MLRWNEEKYNGGQTILVCMASPTGNEQLKHLLLRTISTVICFSREGWGECMSKRCRGSYHDFIALYSDVLLQHSSYLGG